MPNQNLQDDAKRWHNWLIKYHFGKVNAITANAMFEDNYDHSLFYPAYGIIIHRNSRPNAYCSEMCNWLRRNGYQVGSGGTGYYYPATLKEAQEVCDRLEAILKNKWAPIQGMRKGARECYEPIQMREKI